MTIVQKSKSLENLFLDNQTLEHDSRTAIEQL